MALPDRSCLHRKSWLSTGVPRMVWEVTKETKRQNVVSARRSPEVLGPGPTLPCPHPSPSFVPSSTVEKHKTTSLC